jgi:predicted HD superfamily hydrolase involved in NAD metabolism
MNRGAELLAPLRDGYSATGDVGADAAAFLVHHGHPKTATHSAHVADTAKELAGRFGADAVGAECAGWLHDISAIFPAAQRAQIARHLGIEVLPAEEAFPLIVHQKLSVAVARELFGVTDIQVLSAIGCHTTLKRDASLLDKVVFVADKIAWDQAGDPPYLLELLAALAQSLDAAAFCYLDHLWQRRATLRVVHPWVVAAHQQLSQFLEQDPKSWKVSTL